MVVLPIFIPLMAGLASLFVPKKQDERALAAFYLIASAATFIATVLLFGKEAEVISPRGTFGIQFSLRLYHFSAFMLLSLSGLGFVTALYTFSFMKGKPLANQFYSFYLLGLGFANGAILADNLILLLFFWEGTLFTMFGMIVVGHKEAFRTAFKTFIISGVADLCMLAGIALTIRLAGTATMSYIHLPTIGPAATGAFLLLSIGAMAKGGAMPFHSWIPDAAIDAPLPFMAFAPGAFEKILGIYFLVRISLDLYTLRAHSWLSLVLMIVGAVTIVLAVLMALIQKDYKKLLSFHAISQVGYMILGIGTAVPAGIIGGIFHMINNALYKSGLFLTGGAVEKQAGTTDLQKLGGLSRKMPVTFACFIVTALSISGVPPFNGFFSKELVYDGALERGLVFYLAALVGSFFTAASFLKLGHAVYVDKARSDQSKVKEAPWTMLVPMIVIAAFCILFGVYNPLPIRTLIQPGLGPSIEGHHYAGWPHSMILVGATVVVLLGALANHLWGARRAGTGLGAVEHIHYAPIMHPLYDRAERRAFDLYDIGLRVVNFASRIFFGIDRVIDWIYDKLIVRVTKGLVAAVRAPHTGSYALYLLWALAGLALIAVYVLRVM
jgi:formate hydrogenlyase subunit 3/multisubunit Na+/H+ antiporter MnhD subunit